MGKATSHPECFIVEANPYSNGWMSVTHELTSRDLEQELATTGWTFFYIANEVRSMAFGFNRSKMIQAALGRLIAKVKLQKCNCLQIDSVATQSFLGMRYVSLAAHPRHIQRGIVFAGQ
jgi:hypothetical protein